MDQPDQIPENPYRSPESILEVGKETVEQVPEEPAGPSPSKRGCLQFFLHMLIASFLAPGAGAAAVTFLLIDQPGKPVAERVGEAIVAAPFALILLWFLVIPFGILTYPLCLVLSESRVTNRFAWAFGGMLIGLAFGGFLSLLFLSPEALQLTGIGGVVGLVAGLLLRKVWFSSGKAEGA